MAQLAFTYYINGHIEGSTEKVNRTNKNNETAMIV
jgi:hypothetical protein